MFVQLDAGQSLTSSTTPDGTVGSSWFTWIWKETKKGAVLIAKFCLSFTVMTLLVQVLNHCLRLRTTFLLFGHQKTWEIVQRGRRALAARCNRVPETVSFNSFLLGRMSRRKCIASRSNALSCGVAGLHTDHSQFASRGGIVASLCKRMSEMRI